MIRSMSDLETFLLFNKTQFVSTTALKKGTFSITANQCDLYDTTLLPAFRKYLDHIRKCTFKPKDSNDDLFCARATKLNVCAKAI